MTHYIIGFPWETPAHITATLEMAYDLHDRFGAWASMQFATPIRGTQLHEQCVALGLIPPEGIDLKDGSLFQHRPSFEPPNCPPGYVAKARAAFDMKISARRARKLIMNITYKCANRCVFCATGDRISAALGWDKIEAILRQHRDEGTDQLDIDGGEPTLHPRLTDAIRLARDLGYRSINVTSNGRTLHDPAVAQDLLDSGITHLLISLHGATAEVHDAATDAPGSFVQTIAGIDNVMAMRPAHVDTGMNVTIVRSNVDHLLPLTELAIAKGFAKINFQFTTPFGRAYEDVVPPLDETGRAVMRVIDRYADQIRIHADQRAARARRATNSTCRRRSAEARTHHGLRRRSAPRAGQPYEVVGARREKRDVRTRARTPRVRGVPGIAQEKPDMRVERARPVVAVA
jgi:MoaA/NifB/PqqE/SkfB family radical SAM enzyme